jgi:hypothetical protein
MFGNRCDNCELGEERGSLEVSNQDGSAKQRDAERRPSLQQGKCERSLDMHPGKHSRYGGAMHSYACQIHAAIPAPSRSNALTSLGHRSAHNVFLPNPEPWICLATRCAWMTKKPVVTTRFSSGLNAAEYMISLGPSVPSGGKFRSCPSPFPQWAQCDLRGEVRHDVASRSA